MCNFILIEVSYGGKAMPSGCVGYVYGFVRRGAIKEE
jgi:hypothetical protein